MQKNHAEQNQHSIAECSNLNSKALEVWRQFQAPVPHLFAAFTSAEALKAWWWPNGLYADHIDYDFREGGKYFINMRGKVQDKDVSGGMMGEFNKMVQNKLIVMTDNFADENGRAISAREAGMSGDWPENITITFARDRKRRLQPVAFNATRNSGRNSERLRSRMVGVVR